VVAGGKSDAEARYFDPTVIYPVSWDDPIMEDEVFGPILPILTYRMLGEALGRISAAPHALAAYIFSRRQSAIDRFVGELSFATCSTFRKIRRCSSRAATGTSIFAKVNRFTFNSSPMKWWA